MDKEKEIEDFAKALHQYCTFAKFGGELLCGDSAEALVNAGYGNVKQAVKEFADKLKELVPFGLVQGSDIWEAIDKLIKEW